MLYCGGNPLTGDTPRFFKGAAVTSVYEPMILQVNKLRQKVDAGARYIQTQGIFEPESLKRFLDAVDRAKFMNENVSGIAVLQERIDRMAAVAEKGREKGIKGLPGRLGIEMAAELISKIKGTFEPAFDRICMHEFDLDLSKFKKETGVSALDVARGLIDYGMHPPTIYFPLIVHEALMLAPTETESGETLDWAADVYRQLYELGYKDTEFLHNAPHNAQIGRPDDVTASRNPILRSQA